MANIDYYSLMNDSNTKNISSCELIWKSGKYYLGSNIEEYSPDLSDCIKIISSNASLDCKSYTLNMAKTNGIYGMGVWDNVLKNITIKNCNITGFSNGIKLEYINQSLIDNVSVSNSGSGIYLYNSQGNIINRSRLFSLGYGIFFDNSNNNHITGSYIYDNLNNGLYLSGENNLVYNNFFNNTQNIYSAELNYFNVPKTPGINIIGGNYIAGNYWTDANVQGFSDWCYDGDEDRICDENYEINSYSFDYLAYSSGSGSNVNLYPVFSGYSDNNGTVFDGETAMFNVDVINTNGTVWLLINNTNYSANNVYSNNYQVSVTGLLSGNYDYVWYAYGRRVSSLYNSSETRSYTVKDVPKFEIVYVSDLGSVNPFEAGQRNVNVNFTVRDDRGVSDISSGSAFASFTKDGVSRNSGCNFIEGNGEYANYSCTIGMWYFDSPGNWNISVEIRNLAWNLAVNDSNSFFYGALQAYQISSPELNWANVDLSQLNQKADNIITISNTGNININDIGINASDLNGESASESILANWFAAGVYPNSCIGSALVKDNLVSTGISLDYHSSNIGSPVQTDLEFCLKQATGISAQTYESERDWKIKIMS